MFIHGTLLRIDCNLHFTDDPTLPCDREAGDEMAYEIGDTYIDFHNESPIQQWTKIMKALRVHGCEITPSPNHTLDFTVASSANKIMRKFKPITIEEVESVWGNANFGPQLNADKMKVVKGALLKWASGLSTGYTAWRILVELGLMTEKKRLTKRGRRQLWEFFSKNLANVEYRIDNPL